MLTKDFIKEVERLGFIVDKSDEGTALIENSKNVTVAYVIIDRLYEFDTAYYVFEEIPEPTKKKLFNLLVEYTSTPIDEREKPQKFYLEFYLIENDGHNFLNYDKTKDVFTLDTYIETSDVQTLFTQKEIDEIKEKFDATLSDFKQIPIDWGE